MRNEISVEEVTVELRLEDEQGHNQWDGGTVQVDNNENKDSKANTGVLRIFFFLLVVDIHLKF